MSRRFFAVAALALVGSALASTPAWGTHSWNGYHWARTANPFTLKVVDSNTPDWDVSRGQALNDWSVSSVLDVATDASGADDSARTRKRCPMVSGKIRSCNAAYGANGWLGLASINVSFGHIVQGSSKMNDSYLSSGYTATNRQQVMCQEVGHNFGLSHQDESGANLGTCMDYATGLPNPSPNAHDYQQLETIYNQHLDSSTTVAASSASGLPDAVPSWSPASQKAASVFVDRLEDGTELVTFVWWANPIHGWAGNSRG